MLTDQAQETNEWFIDMLLTKRTMPDENDQRELNSFLNKHPNLTKQWIIELKKSSKAKEK